MSKNEQNTTFKLQHLDSSGTLVRTRLTFGLFFSPGVATAVVWTVNWHSFLTRCLLWRNSPHVSKLLGVGCVRGFRELLHTRQESQHSLTLTSEISLKMKTPKSGPSSFCQIFFPHLVFCKIKISHFSLSPVQSIQGQPGNWSQWCEPGTPYTWLVYQWVIYISTFKPMVKWAICIQGKNGDHYSHHVTWSIYKS